MFLQKVDVEDVLYSTIRDDQRYQDTRKQIEDFWEIYRKYAPDGFISKIQTDFHQRWWELYCGVGLLNIGCELITINKDIGPDFHFRYKYQEYYVEAIAPKSGDGVDKLNPLQFGVHNLPEDNFLLRITSAIREKTLKYNCYLEKGVVRKDDVLIIAISSAALGQYGSLMDHPVSAIHKVTKNIGCLAIDIPSGNKHLVKRNGIIKNIRTQIATNIYDDAFYKNISSIIYSNEDPLNAQNNPEKSFEISNNLNACVTNIFNFNIDIC